MTEPTRDAQGRTHASLEHTLHTYRKAWEDEKRKRAALEAEVRELSDALAEITSLNLSSEKGKGWSADAKMQGASVELWVASLVDLFKAQGGPNYVEASVRDVRDGAMYFVIVGPNTAKSPHTIRRELEAEVASHTAYKLSLLDALGPGMEGRSVPDAIRALRAEVERLRAKAAIVDAMERGEIHVARGADQWAIYHTGVAKKFRAPTLLAAYAAATREGTQ